MMIKFIASVTLDLNRNSHDPNSYSVNIYQADTTQGRPEGRFETERPAWNDQSTASGAFATWQAALTAVLDHIGPCVIYQSVDDIGQPIGGMNVCRQSQKVRGRHFVIGSKSDRGIFIGEP